MLEEPADIDLVFSKYAFWDVSRELLDVGQDKVFIISRLFERGKLDDVLFIISLYGKGEVCSVLTNHKYLNRSGLFLAHALLAIPLTNFSSYKRLRGYS